MPTVEFVLTMLPPRLDSRIPDIACFIQSQTHFMFVSTTRSKDFLLLGYRRLFALDTGVIVEKSS
jgi:hypothetical protein